MLQITDNILHVNLDLYEELEAFNERLKLLTDFQLEFVCNCPKSSEKFVITTCSK